MEPHGAIYTLDRTHTCGRGFRGAPSVERASHAVYVTSLATMADGWARLRTPAASEKDVRWPHDDVKQATTKVLAVRLEIWRADLHVPRPVPRRETSRVNSSATVGTEPVVPNGTLRT